VVAWTQCYRRIQDCGTLHDVLPRRRLTVPLSWQAVAGELLAAAAHDGPKAAQPDSSSGPVTDAFSARSPVRLSLLGELLSFPPERQPLDEDQLRHGLQRLTAVVGQADDDSSAAAAIAAALTMVAGECTMPGCACECERIA